MPGPAHWPLLFAVSVLTLVACATADVTPTPTATPTPSTLQSPDPTPALTATPTPTPTADGGATPTAKSIPQTVVDDALPAQGDPTAIMQASLAYLAAYLGAPGEVDTSIIRRMGESGDTAFVPVLVELLFFGYVMPRNVVDEISAALAELTGESSAEFDWPEWITWLGQHPEVSGPPGYAAWKGQLYGLIDPQFSLFFYSGVKARIRLEEIVWGGVPKDGIPDLTDSPVIPASEATYLNPDDRVFGVSINGDHRAYPLRIMNPHEMANDVVGGEPIALAY